MSDDFAKHYLFRFAAIALYITQLHVNMYIALL